MKILSTVPLTDSQQNLIRDAAPKAELVARHCRTREEVSALVARGCDVLLTTWILPADLLERAPELKWVQLTIAGAEHVLDTPLKSTRVLITTASGIHAVSIAEYTIGSMLAYTRQFHIAMRLQLQHKWLHPGPLTTSLTTLRDKTLGIIGYGSIGRETARLARAFEMRVLALKRDPLARRDSGYCTPEVGDPEGTIPERFYSPEEREAILRESDYVQVTLPLTEQTRGFIGAREIAAMKPGAYIVNIGRGPVIDESALIEALKAGKIGGAGLDVFDREPLPSDSPLWDMENVILTPHMGGPFFGYMDRVCEMFAENLGRFISGQPLLNLVDRRLGY